MKTEHDFLLINPRNSTFTLVILDKIRLYSWEFCKIVLHPLINSETWTSFSVDPFQHDISSISQKILCAMPSTSSPPVWFYMSFDHFKEGEILKGGGGGEPPLNETRCEEVLIKKVFHLTQKENIKKTKKVLRKPGKL